MSYSIYLKFLLLCIVFMPFNQADVSGQTKEDFEEIFRKETEGDLEKGRNKFQNIDQLSYFPDTLPTWFFRTPQARNNNVYAIGISDPDLNEEEATRQALHRAKTMAVLFNNAKIQYFRDVYTSEFSDRGRKRYGQRFDTYFKVSATGYADSTCFAIEEQHLTRYNEIIMLIKYTPRDKDSTLEASNPNLISAIGTALYIEAQIGEVFEPQAEYEFISILQTPDKITERAHFVYTQRGNKFLSNSEFDGQIHEFPLYSYKYANPSWQKNTSPLVSYNGLWSIYSKKLLRQLTLETEQNSVSIRTLGEQYVPQLNNLTREVATKNSKMLLNGIEFGIDSIGFDFQLKDL
ncbi:MAG: hypothetical protein ACLFNU_12830 [Bacteroidales bacterium]